MDYQLSRFSRAPVFQPPRIGPPQRYKPPIPHRNVQRKRKRNHRSVEEVPRTVDVIGSGGEITLRGHIDLLIHLPVHHIMHKELLKKFKAKPGNYEGKYGGGQQSRASVVSYGNGYLAVHFYDDISQPEMSEFLLNRQWKLMFSHYENGDGKNIVFEKWTNQLNYR